MNSVPSNLGSEVRKNLSPEQISILRHCGTEPPWSGPLLDEKRSGIYSCVGCDNELFKSDAKFDSGSGWPSFFEAISDESVLLRSDFSLGMTRVEVVCANCEGHLGHLFDDAVGTPTGQRFCINSLVLEFEEEVSSGDQQ